jgi:hypothetical protein
MKHINGGAAQSTMQWVLQAKGFFQSVLLD